MSPEARYGVGRRRASVHPIKGLALAAWAAWPLLALSIVTEIAARVRAAGYACSPRIMRYVLELRQRVAPFRQTLAVQALDEHLLASR